MQLKVFACGMGTETNSFCPIPTSRDDFKNDVFEGISPKTKGAFDLWREAAAEAGVAFQRGSNLWAMPAGPVIKSTVDALQEQLLDEIRDAAPFDILLLYMHGAMMSDGALDPEADLLRKAREILGDDVVIGVELDPHANISPAYVQYADIVVEYKEWPHDDIGECAIELFDLCLRTARGDVRPTMAVADAGLLSLIDTKFGPGKELVNALHELEARPGVLSASINHGFAWSDKPSLGTKALVVTDNDQSLAEELATEIAESIFQIRDQVAIGRDAFTPSEAIDIAIRKASTRHKVALCEGADAILCGGAGDATHLLQVMLEQRLEGAAFAPLWDPMAVEFCMRVGEGAVIDVRLGGKASRVSGDPVDLSVEVVKIVREYRHEISPTFGFDGGSAVRVRTEWGFDIILVSERFPILSPSMFTDFSIDLSEKSVLGVKAFRMARMAFKDVVKTFCPVITTGAMSEDLFSLDYKNAPKTLWPFSEERRPQANVLTSAEKELPVSKQRVD